MSPSPIEPLDRAEVVADRVLAFLSCAFVGIIIAAQFLRAVAL